MKEDSMNKNDDPEMLDNYDFSKGVRGKYIERLKQHERVVVLDPDVAPLFPTSESVNDALRALVKIARQSVPTAEA